MPQPSDAEVLARSLRDPEAFRTIFQRHALPIYRYLARRTDQQVAQDLLGEVFVRAFEHRDRYDIRYDDARPWLYGIASNLLRTHYRRERRGRQARIRLRALPSPDPSGEVNDRLEAEDLTDRLTGALNRLSSGQLDVLLLYIWEDLTYEEIAHALKIPVGTVRSRLHRARRVLQKELAGKDIS